MLNVLVNDAAPVLAEVLRKFSLAGVSTRSVVVSYDWSRVEVAFSTLPPGAPSRIALWDIVRSEFRSAGWGYQARFRNGIGRPQTGAVFSHPKTLTRVGY